MNKHLISKFILAAYVALLIKMMILKDLPMIIIGQVRFNFGGIQERPANFIPFKSIVPYLFGEGGWLIAGLNIIGNIILLVPIGLLVPMLYNKMTWRKAILLAIGSGMVIEIIQVILHVGIFDVDDVILNAFGVIIGYWTLLKLKNMLQSNRSKKIIMLTFIILSISVTIPSLVYIKKNGLPFSFETPPEREQSNLNRKENSRMLKGQDPCNGTGGTGEIISVENQSITIKRKDNISQIIKLTSQTVIRNSTSTISVSDLKIAQHVTLIIDETETASLVLVCNESL